jgi:hypothetical protein
MKLTITYPESWAEIKLKDYLEYYKLIKPYENTDDFGKKHLELAAQYFCKVPAEYLYNLPAATFNKVDEYVSKLFSDTNKVSLITTFEVENTKYGFIPNLDDMAYGEYLDLISYTSNKDMWTFMPIIMSILYRPVVNNVGKLYTIEPYNGTKDDRIEMFKHILTMDVVFGATSFFLDLQKDLLTGILTYSVENLKGMTDIQTLAALEDSQKNGLDIIQLQSLLTKISQNLTT